MNVGLPSERPDWLLDEGVPFNQAILAKILADRSRPFIEGLLGRTWEPSNDTDPYVRRVWECANYHGPRFATAVRVSHSAILDRLERGDLGYDRLQSNVLRDVCFAQALEQRENIAAEQFERDFMPTLNRVARRIAGQRGIDMIENFLAELILPRESSPPRIAGYLGKTSLQGWLAAVVGNFCRGLGRTRRETQLPETADPVALETVPIDLDSNDCSELLQPLFREAVAAVSIDDRLLLKFLVLDDVPQKDVARILNLHSGNVTRRRQRATEQIWRQIQSRSTEHKKSKPVRDCLDLVLGGDNRQLRTTLGSVLAEALPSDDFPDMRGQS